MANEKRLIDANELLKFVGSRLGFVISKRELLQAVEMQPTVDAEEVVRGTWKHILSWKTHWMCSECGRLSVYKENYCPSCGAKMEVNR